MKGKRRREEDRQTLRRRPGTGGGVPDGPSEYQLEEVEQCDPPSAAAELEPGTVLGLAIEDGGDPSAPSIGAYRGVTRIGVLPEEARTRVMAGGELTQTQCSVSRVDLGGPVPDVWVVVD